MSDFVITEVLRHIGLGSIQTGRVDVISRRKTRRATFGPKPARRVLRHQIDTVASSLNRPRGVFSDWTRQRQIDGVSIVYIL